MKTKGTTEYKKYGCPLGRPDALYFNFIFFKFSNSRICSFTHLFIYSLLITVLSSCFKEKLLKAPSATGIGQTNTIPLQGPNYDDQFFYSLATNTVVSSNSRFAYDLMFDCNPTTFHIWLNSAKFMCAADVGILPFGQVTMQDTIGHNFNYERGAYSTDSSALGDWRDSISIMTNSGVPNPNGHVYIINLGVDTFGNSFGFIKMQVDTFFNGAYTVLYSYINNQNPTVITVPKDPTRNYKYLSVASNQLLPIEPDKSTWDLCFTHYTVVFYVPYTLPYPVTGVLSNPSKVESYLDSTLIYDSVTIRNFNPSLLQIQRDAIGYDWKTYTGHYTLSKTYDYFIAAGNNTFYKLHFIGYYQNGTGIEGYISFQYSQL